MSPDKPEKEREVILCLREGGDDAGVFQQPPWAGRWTCVTPEPPDALAGSFGAHLRLSPGMGVPHLSNTSGTLWITELDQLEAALEDESWCRIIFAPSYAAVLDALRSQRETLTARSDLICGHILKCEDMVVVEGGEGVAANLLDAIAGQALCYDLNEGEPITFGMIDAAENDGGKSSESLDGGNPQRRTSHIKQD